jgi:hypothetical protein
LLKHFFIKQFLFLFFKEHRDRQVCAARSLVRQSTDLTSSFPLKGFQKINSETVEIPGLNVKVVRYRLENDLGKIDPHLYKKYNAGGIDANAGLSKGELYFSLRYTEDNQMFSIIINRAEVFNNLQSSSTHDVNASNNGSRNRLIPLTRKNSVSAPNSPNMSKPDTYVRIQLLPDNKKRKYTTRIQRKNYTPVYDERFQFQLPFDELQHKTLYLSHYEFGRFSKHELIGTVRLNDIHLIKDLNTSDVEMIKNLIPLAEVRA